MDAYNLAVVFAPNLVKSTNPLRDVQMCAIPGGPSMWPASQAAPSSSKETKSTLGMVFKCCIERYFEVFDEVQDRTEAVAPSNAALILASHGSDDDLNDISHDDGMEDVMLVMPHDSSLEPHPSLAQSSRLPPSAWGSQNVTATELPYQPRQSRHQRIASGGGTSHHGLTTSPTQAQSPSLIGLGVRSMATGGTPAPFPSVSKSRSVISVEKDSGPLTAAGTRRGSIRLGTGTSKGTIGKSAGAAVEALGITASGFFAPPGTATKSQDGNYVT